MNWCIFSLSVSFLLIIACDTDDNKQILHNKKYLCSDKIIIKSKNTEYNLQNVVRCHLCENSMPPFYFDICYKHLCEDCKKKPSRGNSAQTADLNKTSRKQRTTMNKTGEDWHTYTIPSLAKQKINDNQTSRQHGSMLLSKRI